MRWWQELSSCGENSTNESKVTFFTTVIIYSSFEESDRGLIQSGFEDLSKTLNTPYICTVSPPLRKYGSEKPSENRLASSVASVIRVLRVSTWESASGCENGFRSRTPKHVAVGAILEFRAPIFAGFFHVRGGWVTDLTENGTSSISSY